MLKVLCYVDSVNAFSPMMSFRAVSVRVAVQRRKRALVRAEARKSQRLALGG